MPAQSKLYATSLLSHVTQRWRARRQGLQRLLHTQTLSGACLAVSHAARSPQHETLACSDGLPAVCGGNGVGNGLPCPCDRAMSRRVSGSPSQPATLQPHKNLPRYRHGIGHFISSPWSMTANHGARAHRASPPHIRWRSPPLVFLTRARSEESAMPYVPLPSPGPRRRLDVHVAAVSPSSRTFARNAAPPTPPAPSGPLGDESLCQSRVCTEP